ncbi:MAG: cytochrome-c peroxidase [Alphaproteobacteria bacterium]
MRMTRSIVLTAAIAVAVQLWAATASAETMKAPPLAPLGKVPVPPDNPQTKAKIALGLLLFFDPRLSGDASTSCASCHEPKQGWAFGDPLSRGYPGTVHWRNSQSIINSAYLGKLFWAGSAKSLEAQAPSAAKGAVAGNGESEVMETRLAFIPEYRKRFRAVFGDEWPKIRNAWRAIAAFERTLVQTDTPLDRYLRGKKSALTKQQIEGMKLFNGKAGCIQCHNGALATDQKYHNIGVPPAERWNDDGLAQITFRYEQYAKGANQAMYRKIKDDAGLYYRTKQKNDKGKFRTPSLRYTKYTAPYMHNGAFFELREVIEFYNKGGGANEFARNKSKLIKPLGLSETEMDALEAFLEAFSGKEIKFKAPKLPPYAPLPAPAK